MKLVSFAFGNIRTGNKQPASQKKDTYMYQIVILLMLYIRVHAAFTPETHLQEIKLSLGIGYPPSFPPPL